MDEVLFNPNLKSFSDLKQPLNQTELEIKLGDKNNSERANEILEFLSETDQSKKLEFIVEKPLEVLSMFNDLGTMLISRTDTRNAHRPEKKIGASLLVGSLMALLRNKSKVARALGIDQKAVRGHLSKLLATGLSPQNLDIDWHLLLTDTDYSPDKVIQFALLMFICEVEEKTGNGKQLKELRKQFDNQSSDSIVFTQYAKLFAFKKQFK